MIGSAFRSDFDSASTVPSAALIVTVDVVFSGMYVTDAINPKCSVMLYCTPALNTGCYDDDAFAST